MKINLGIILMVCLTITGCNSVYYKPDSIDPTRTVYADRGGYSMKRSIKQRLEERGYRVVVGKATGSRDFNDGDTSIDLDSSTVPTNAHYVFKVSERSERFDPVWCIFNGFWFWKFNVSVADQKTGEEIMTWRGRGCVDSSLNMLDDILDQMEIRK